MSTPRRWVATTGGSLGDVLRALGLDDASAARAIGEGRVFVGRTRARAPAHPVTTRDEVLVHPPRAATALPEPFVLYDARGVLAVDKPAGIPTIADLRGAAGSLIDLAASATGRAPEELHPTSRLDREVSGVVVFATGRNAADAIAAARGTGRYRRRYLAIARGDLADDRARWTWAIARDRDPRRRRAVPEGSTDASPAASRVVVVRRHPPFLLLALAPETGRTHQLRVHAARAGVPLLGDVAYGGPARITRASGQVVGLDRIALHCAAVDLDLGLGFTFRAPIPPQLRAIADAAGLGEEGAWEDALSLAP